MVDVFSKDCNDFFERSQELNIISDHQKDYKWCTDNYGRINRSSKSTDQKRWIKNNKSPGSDGFTGEFYKRFWEDIKWLLLDQGPWAVWSTMDMHQNSLQSQEA